MLDLFRASEVSAPAEPIERAEQIWREMPTAASRDSYPKRTLPGKNEFQAREQIAPYRLVVPSHALEVADAKT